MSGYLQAVAARAVGAIPVLKPRLASRFEDVADPLPPEPVTTGVRPLREGRAAEPEPRAVAEPPAASSDAVTQVPAGRTESKIPLERELVEDFAEPAAEAEREMRDERPRARKAPERIEAAEDEDESPAPLRGPVPDSGAEPEPVDSREAAPMGAATVSIPSVSTFLDHGPAAGTPGQPAPTPQPTATSPSGRARAAAATEAPAEATVPTGPSPDVAGIAHSGAPERATDDPAMPVDEKTAVPAPARRVESPAAQAPVTVAATRVVRDAAPEPETVVRVTIGRIEVRAERPAPPQPLREPPSVPRRAEPDGLDRYLERRNGTRR